MKLKYILERFRWVKVLFSPFKPFKVGLYMGKTQLGVPYFFPRKLVKATPEIAYKAASEELKRRENWNKSNADSKFKHEIKPIGEIFHEMMERKHFVPLKVGFSYCSLGWKTKYDDFRHEWNPILSFVFFGYQIALTFYSPYHSHYWEPWLYYEYRTDKTKSKRERIEQCIKEAPETWSSGFGEDKVTTDYYTLILKQKYLK